MISNWVKFKVKKIIDVGIIQVEVLEYSYYGDLRKNIIISGDLGDIKKECVYKGLIKEYTTSRISYTCRLDGKPELVDIDDRFIVDMLKERVKGLGEAKAEKIVSKLGKDTLQLIKTNYECLLQVPEIGESSAKRIHESIITYNELQDMLSCIKMIDSRKEIIDTIVKALGSRAVRIIRDNPYGIYEGLGISLKIADDIAVKQGIKFDDINRIKALIMSYISNEIEQNGDLYTEKESLILGLPEYADKIGRFKEKFKNVSLETLDKALSSLSMDGKIVIEDNIDGNVCLYRADYHFIEEAIVGKVEELLSSNKKNASLKVDEISKLLIRNKEKKQDRQTLSEQQTEAVIMAITNRICIITGGAGTGKSSIISTITNLIEELKPTSTVELASPTGKAAIRLKDITAKEAMTIHRLFNIPVGDSQKNKTNKIESNFLIIDECSMVDSYMFYQVINNISDKTNLIIVGDYEQLSSVGPGCILRDLINSCKIPVVKLMEVFRQAQDSLILENANRLIKMEFEGIIFDDNEFSFMECSSKSILKTIIQTINTLKLNGNSIDDIMVLSPVKLGDLGTERLNGEIRDYLQVNKNKALSKFCIGDRVMQVINNYDLGVMNGEIGQLIKVKSEDDSITYIVRFGERKVKYNDSNIKELELAFSITIHKSQGSEFPIVIIPVGESNMTFVNINMIYTGITRSKMKVILIGSKEVFYNTIKKEERNRKSRIVEKLSS
jgi:exodeoxyribonuclease V alpha subunit